MIFFLDFLFCFLEVDFFFFDIDFHVLIMSFMFKAFPDVW